jgi:uroporphyrinogen-III decarboxylase
MLSRYNSEYLIKSAEDFPVYEYLLHNEIWSFDEAAYAENEAQVGCRGVTQFFARRTPLQSLFIDAMGFENAVLFMHDHPDVVDAYIKTQTAADDRMYNLICAHQVPIFNLGDNIDHHMDSPRIWRKYLAPNYERRCAQLHAAGIHTSIHVDGAMKRLLGELAHSPFESVEACTPLPQGDVTLEEIKAALGERILLDGIPAIFFLPSFPLEELKACTEEVVRLFHPRLILGVSDEVPPDSDIERVRMVGEWVQEMRL